ncbi:MAG: reprolysin-like metallopeptidase, partial [Bacteroidota bacterium]
MKRILTTVTALFLAVFAFAQGGFWQDANQQLSINNQQLPTSYRSLSLDLNTLVEYLRQAPMEFTETARNQPLVLDLPMPEGGVERFAVAESPIMEPGLAAAFPMIKTFAARSLEDPFVTARLGYSPQGFHAIVRGSKDGTWLIQPEPAGSFYTSYFEKNAPNHEPTHCGLDHAEMEAQLLDDSHLAQSLITNHQSPRTANTVLDLHTYRLALATTAEYSVNHGGTVSSVLTAVATVINQANSFYEREAAIRLILIDSTTNTFFFPPNNGDPYTNGNAGVMINENPDVINGAYGNSGYDIGHVFGITNSGGVIGIAQLGSVCSANKARGASNQFGGELYETFIHEAGHQFNATHTFNLCDGDNENGPTGYEPGGGSTIMAYAGACTTNSVQAVADDYFHVNSLERVYNFSRDPNSGGICNQVVAVGNNTPVASIPIAGGFYIPVRTPFELTGEATDADGDDLEYNWEQYDIGPASQLGMPQGSAPLFRSFPPSSSTTRVFPKIQTIVFNQNDDTELLPTITRPMTFRFTARDNHPEAGGWGFAEIAFNATAAAGPFRVTQPNNSGLSWEVGKYMEVTWDVANTDVAPVN